MQMMKTLRDESGQVMVLTVLSIAVLIGFVAFAVDIGMLLRAKRVVQTAADSGAIAAAAELNYGDCQAAAEVDAGQNVTTTGTYPATITVSPSPSCTPTSGAFANQAGYVQVTVSQPQPTFFINAFEALVGNPQLGNFTVSASATATLAPNSTCIYTLSPNGTLGLGIALSGGASLSLPTCGILDAATGPEAISVDGATVKAKSVGVVGGAYQTPADAIEPTPVNVASVNDPLSYLTAPAYDPASCVAKNIGSGSAPLDPSTSSTPGILCYNGLSISGAGTSVTLNPGVYVINGAQMSVSKGASLTGSGVTVYLTNDALLDINSDPGTTANLSAPLSGPYDGILFYQDPLDPSPMEIGAAGSLTGIFYLKNALLNVTSTSMTFNSSVVAGSFWMSGSANFQAYAPVGGTSPILSPRLAE
jgi:Flp pilus assembly protein TadG